jgi:hypothetical protein
VRGDPHASQQHAGVDSRRRRRRSLFPRPRPDAERTRGPQAGAAEAAVSAALRKTAVGRNWSVQDLHFCLATNSGESKSCRSSASSLIDVLKPFTAATRALVLDKCLPYEAPDAPLDQDLCDYK